MKVILECECGNRVEIEPETKGNVAFLSRILQENDFYVADVDIDVSLSDDTVTDADDVNVKLRNVQIDCRKCGEHIVLDF